MRTTLLFVFVGLASALIAQSPAFLKQRAEKLAAPSPFEAVIAGKTDQKIIYQDDDVVVFAGLRPQAPVHLLIVPRKRIATLNDATEADARLLGRMILVAQKIAREHGVAESGYRLVFNTNEDAGQSVFHLHLHLLGGMNLGPMLPQTYKAP